MVTFPLQTGHSGWLELIVGPMFSGKSEELIRRVTRVHIAKQRLQVFKPAIDDRYHPQAIRSHSGRHYDALAIESVAMAQHYYDPRVDVVAVDEAQFLDAALVSWLNTLADTGKRVIVAGLDLDFRGEPFGIMPELMARAERVDKLSAVCTQCGAAATRSQRLIAGNPAHYHEPIIVPGSSEHYEARCRAHHQVPRQTAQPPMSAVG